MRLSSLSYCGWFAWETDIWRQYGDLTPSKRPRSSCLRPRAPVPPAALLAFSDFAGASQPVGSLQHRAWGGTPHSQGDSLEGLTSGGFLWQVPGRREFGSASIFWLTVHWSPLLQSPSPLPPRPSAMHTSFLDPSLSKHTHSSEHSAVSKKQ